MTNLPIILDNLIEEELQDQIEDAMFDCPWCYRSDNVLESKVLGTKYRKILNPFQYDISPTFVANIATSVNKKTYDKVLPVVKEGCNKINFNIEKIKRCIAAIHATIRDQQRHDTIHVNADIPHLVMLYYVNDSDGDTILYDKTLKDIPFGTDYPDDYCKLNITHRISPKKGRVLFFNGSVYHASSAPTKSMRCIITLDLFGEFKDGSYKFPAPIENKKCNFMYQ